MVNWFFWLAMAITLIFFILVMILFVLQWVIYSRVEKTMLHYNKQIYSRGMMTSGPRSTDDYHIGIHLDFPLHVDFYPGRGYRFLAQA